MVKQDGNKSNIERRKHERVNFATSISVTIDTGDEKIDVKGDSRDLSLKGVFIETKKEFPIGSRCSVEISLSGDDNDIKLHVKGIVARNVDNGAGIIFDSIDVDSFTHLKNIVKYNSTDN